MRRVATKSDKVNMKESCRPPDESSWLRTESAAPKGADSLSIRVPFPACYPDTEFRRSTDFLADLLLSYDRALDTVFVHSFYVHAHDSDVATPAEKRACKGLGKRMLCHAVALLIARGSITPDATIALEGPESRRAGVDATRRWFVG